MRTRLVLALALLLPMSAAAASKPDAAAEPAPAAPAGPAAQASADDAAAAAEVPALADPAAFADALEACTAATHQAPHPFMKGFTIEHAINGEAEGHCAYSQTMPGGMHMACSLTEKGRAGLAEEFREQARGRMSGSTSSQPAWTAECDIVSKDGKRTPMGG